MPAVVSAETAIEARAVAPNLSADVPVIKPNPVPLGVRVMFWLPLPAFSVRSVEAGAVMVLIVCVPVNVFAASVRAIVALVVGKVIVVESVPARVSVFETVRFFAPSARVPVPVAVKPESVGFPESVRVRAASPRLNDKVRPAVKTSELASVKSNAAPVERMPRPVSAVFVPPLIVGLVSVLFVSVSVVALPTSVSVAAGRDRVTAPSAPVTGATVIVPEVAFLKSTEPTDVPATPRVSFEVPSVVIPATTFVSTVPAPRTTAFAVRFPPVFVTVPPLALDESVPAERVRPLPTVISSAAPVAAVERPSSRAVAIVRPFALA